MSNADWLTVSRENECPICQHRSWCCVSRDGAVAMCMRVAEGGKPIEMKDGATAYIHVIDESRQRERPQVRRRERYAEKRYLSGDEIRIEMQTMWLEEEEFEVDFAAKQLRVSTAALRAFRIGVRKRDGAYAFAMRDGKQQLVGIRFRSPDGEMWSLKGGRNGLFIPNQLYNLDPLLIVEGATDACAAWDLKYDVIGRPSCSACDDMVAEFCGRRDVVIVADADDVGHRGAEKLARRLCKTAKRVRMITPIGSKDFRAWVQVGATRAMVDMIIDQATTLRRAV